LHIFSLFSIYIKIFPDNDALSALEEGLFDFEGPRMAGGWGADRKPRAGGMLRRVHRGVAEEVLGQNILIVRIDDGAYGLMQF